MAKFEKKFIFIDTPNQSRLSGDPAATQSFGQKLSRLLTVPAMIAGGVAGAVFFSAFLVFLLIPLAAWGAYRWWRFRTLQASQQPPVIDGEFTVIDPQDPKQR